MVAIIRRELRSYFVSPVGYSFIGFFLVLNGLMLLVTNLITGSPAYQFTIGSMSTWSLLAMPLLTMRLLSDEKRLRTDQLLLTVPVSVGQVVLAKFLAALAVFGGGTLITVIYPVALSFFGDLAVGRIIGAYLGYLLLGGAFIAIGIFMSSLTENQLIAAILTLAALALMMWILPGVRDTFITASTVSGIVFASVVGALVALLVYLATKNVTLTGVTIILFAGAIVVVALLSAQFFETLLLDFLQWFLLGDRFDVFMTGVIALSPVVYLLSFIGLFLFLTVRVVEKARWA